MSYTDTMELEFRAEDNSPVSDQEAVIEEFHEGTGRVAVDAAAGTGKTTTMLYTVAETVVREATEEYNPFEDILLTTFTRDAASELKQRLKSELRRHKAAGGDVPQDVFRWIETDSHIQTMDSFFHELLTQISLEINLPPDFEIEEGVELQQLRDEIFDQLRISHSDEFEQLDNAYPDESWREYPPDSVEQMLTNAQQKCRELGITPVEAKQQMVDNLAAGHGGQTPPTTLDDVNELLEVVVAPTAEVTTRNSPRSQEEAYDEMVDHVRDTYERSLDLIEAFCAILQEYEAQYDEATREAGVFTFRDATHILREFLNRSEGADFAESLGRKFDYVFVDEFQDTSIAQCDILQTFIRNESETQLLLIGDVKQSIYEWRSADPSIFSEIIEETRGESGGARIPHLDVDNVTYHALTSNFRSHEDIVAATNHVFSQLFDDDTRGDISDAINIEYTPVEAASPSAGASSDSAHLHVLDLEYENIDGYPRRQEIWTPDEADRIAGTIASMVGYSEEDAAEAPVLVADGTDEDGAPQTRPPKPGDITLLFRSTRYMHVYADALRDYGINAAPKTTDDLFAQAEIKLLIDVLYWFANPHETGSILRILRSPLVACSDETLRSLAAREYYLEDLIGGWPEELPKRDKEQIDRLVELRDDLRWEREGSKTDLVNRILRHTCFDAIVLADIDGLRRYGNLWLLTEIVSDWEDEELLPYRDFVDRLMTLREQANQSESSYEVVDIADRHDESTVSLTTVHAAKGQEYSIVFLCDLLKQSTFPKTQHERLVANRQNGFALRPKASDLPFPPDVSFPTPNDTDDVWIGENRDVNDIPELTGPIWLSDERDNSGHLRFRNPLNDFVEAEQAEFWRMFYVAFTRAEDHLFLGVSQLPDWIDFTEYTTWNVAFNNFMMPSEGWEAEGVNLPIRGGSEDPDTLDIGVNEIPRSDPETTDTISAPDLEMHLESPPSNRREQVPFRPARVSATQIHELLECQRRYQYQYVQEISSSRLQVTSTDPIVLESSEKSIPRGLNPDQWGDIVHEAFERRLEDESSLEAYLRKFTDSIQEAVEMVIEDAQSHTAEFREALGSPDQAHAEFTVSTILDLDGNPLRIDGDIDLLYQRNGSWYLVDYKTAARPDDEYEELRYERQLRTYTWLLEREYGIEVQEASLIYIDLDADPHCRSEPLPEAVETDGFEEELRNRITGLEITTSRGLTAEPAEHRCSACPYRASRGGPCENE